MTTTMESERVETSNDFGKTTQALNSKNVEVLREILEACEFDVMASTGLPGRDPTYSPIPQSLNEQVRGLLTDLHLKGLYSHQALSIAASLAGEDICLSTTTSSGKSLVFMSLGTHEVLQDADARVLVLYPAKALIQDQLAKWTTFLKPFGLTPGFIDGSVLMAERNEILLTKRVILMTPDVTHAWFMNHLNDPGVVALRKNLRLLVLDETHVYDGVFGTNMAFFLRRLRAVSSQHRLICSTATLGLPGDFVFQLTGRKTKLIGTEQDGSRISQKDILVVRKHSGEGFESAAKLIRSLARSFPGRFLVFSDSRKRVEVLTAASHRRENSSADQEPAEGQEPTPVADSRIGVLPYRAGYESQDRRQIQEALTSGRLRGVVSTSALELGLDIGEIDLVVLLDTPVSMKSFWQRVGRAGRKNPGICVIINSRRVIGNDDDGLEMYLSRPVEPNWLYLHNRYAQYTNALCAAVEIGQINGNFDRSYFNTLPEQFLQFLENELNPTVPVPGDLYPLKQAAEAGAHREFPLRNGIEKNFQVRSSQGDAYGDLSFSQALREAYPGAVYYYMAKPYRVRQFGYRNGEIMVTPERHYTTKPVSQVMAFPDFQTGLLKFHRAKNGFLAEVEMQVSERVTGFKEKRGKTETEHTYAPGSPYSQQPLNRFIRTTGVCWFFTHAFAMSEAVLKSILNAFCNEYGIQSRDVGIGRFHARQSPMNTGPVNGVCLFDNSNGSLRLTERLVENFAKVLNAALAAETNNGNDELSAALENFGGLVEGLSAVRLNSQQAQADESNCEKEEELVRVVAPGQQAIFTDSRGQQEVTVLGCHFTPKGLQYHLQHATPGIRWMVPVEAVEPINGVTQTLLYNLMTGERPAAA